MLTPVTLLLAFTGSQLVLPAVRQPLVVAKSALVTSSGTALKKESPIIMKEQVLHSITAERLELVRGMHDYMRDVVSCGTLPVPGATETRWTRYRPVRR